MVTPTYPRRGARQEIAAGGGLERQVLEREDCEKLAMGAYLGVAQGSEEPPKFIHLTYAPKGRPRRRVVVIGKGITFDSGGLDLKTADGMLRMKDDMSGAAAVLGIFQALPQLKPPVEVHGLIAATENMPSGTAQRPGDIVRAMNGLTIEIGNTDAEGRLTLADALAYAVKEIKPDEMIDMATLTGAIVVALGPRASPASSRATTGSPRGCSPPRRPRASGCGGMPLHDEYKDGHQERHRRPQQHLEPARRRRHRGRPLHARLHGGHPVGASRHRGHRLRRARARRSGPRAPPASACAPSSAI